MLLYGDCVDEVRNDRTSGERGLLVQVGCKFTSASIWRVIGTIRSKDGVKLSVGEIYFELRLPRGLRPMALFRYLALSPFEVGPHFVLHADILFIEVGLQNF